MIFNTFGKIKTCNSEFQFKFYSGDIGTKYCPNIEMFTFCQYPTTSDKKYFATFLPIFPMLNQYFCNISTLSEYYQCEANS